MSKVDNHEMRLKIFFEKVKARWPQLDEGRANALVDVWAREHQVIIDRMMQLSEDAIGNALHIDARPHAILAMAKFQLLLTDRILDWKLSNADAGTLDPVLERESLCTEHGRARIENTAQICAQHIWGKVITDLRRRWPLVVEPSKCNGPRPSIKDLGKRPPQIRRNHYSPIFANQHWVGSDGKTVRVYSRGLSGSVVSVDMSYRKWGYEEFLYSGRLERYLSLVDCDGARSCQRLLRTLPLTELDKRCWIAFLVIQYFRTPSMLKVMTERLRHVLPTIAPQYPRDIKSLKAAYETLFTNNNLYAAFHCQIAPKRWKILWAPAGNSFIRPDNSVVIRDDGVSDWSLLYPMTPTALFHAGPEAGAGYEADFVSSVHITPPECAALNRRLAASASHSVIALPTAADGALRRDLESYLGTQNPSSMAGPKGLWGPLELL